MFVKCRQILIYQRMFLFFYLETQDRVVGGDGIKERGGRGKESTQGIIDLAAAAFPFPTRGNGERVS